MIRKINEHGSKGLNGFSLSRMGYEHELSLITHELIHELFLMETCLQDTTEIVPWEENKNHRMDPENGLCLSATYDAAFDKHLISFDDDYRMIVSKEIKDYYSNDVVNEYFGKFEGKQINFPVQFMPSKKLLEMHRDLVIHL